MFFLQEYEGGSWSDIYTHESFKYLVDVWSIFRIKYPERRFRIVEVIESV